MTQPAARPAETPAETTPTPTIGPLAAEGNVTGMPGIDLPKPARPAAKPKASKPRSAIERVPAADVIAFLDRVGISRSQLAAAMKVSPSLVTEWVGRGRGNLLAKSRWPEVQKTAKAFAKGLK